MSVKAIQKKLQKLYQQHKKQPKINKNKTKKINKATYKII